MHRRMNEKKLEYTLIELGVPERFLDARKELIINPERWKIAWDAFSIGQSLYLFGSQGRGKTFLAVALLVEALLIRYAQFKKNGSLTEQDDFSNKIYTIMRFKNANELISDMQVGIQEHQRKNFHAESDIDISLKYSKYPILVLDEIGLRKPSEYTVQSYDMLINTRYQNPRSRQTIYTSNLSLDELAAKYDTRIASRLAELCVEINVIGNDLRLNTDKHRKI